MNDAQGNRAFVGGNIRNFQTNLFLQGKGVSTTIQLWRRLGHMVGHKSKHAAESATGDHNGKGNVTPGEEVATAAADEQVTTGGVVLDERVFSEPISSWPYTCWTPK